MLGLSAISVAGADPARRLRRHVAIAAGLVVLAAGVTWRLVARRAPAPPPPAPIAASPPPVVAPEPPAAPAVAAAAPADAPRHVRVTVAGPLETAFVGELGRELGAPLTQVVTRTLVWWVQVPGDLRIGDTLDVLFTQRPDGEPIVHAVRFASAKTGRTFEAYRFQPSGAPVARTYTRDGRELELRLVDSPLDDYEQVTSLLRDGRGHKGVDFRTPAGTPVRATFDAVVARRTWSFRANGNCVDLREEGGAHRNAYFLHLSELPAELRVGQRVKRGDVVAYSGNTGHSFAPHLHYQLMSSAGAVLDPFQEHPTTRRALADADRAAFAAEVARLDALLAAAGAPRQAALTR